MNQSALATALGMTRQAVSKLKRQGMPVHSVKAAQAWRERRQNLAARKPLPKAAAAARAAEQSAPGPEAPAEPASKRDTARAERETYQAQLARLEFEQKSGKLVEADQIKVRAFKLARSARDQLLTMPDRLAPILASETDVLEVHRLLTEDIERTCERIAAEAASIA